jgi:hypothetical protein
MVRRVIAISGSPLADWAVFNDKFRAMNTRQLCRGNSINRLFSKIKKINKYQRNAKEKFNCF